MCERETRDFMSVDSFSQLPFMRREKPPNPPIRLFGFDFPRDPSPVSDTDKRRSSSPTPPDKAGETLRRFECNYCFRNFPTSQALGGHQNAHKRERQHAKRASLAAAGGEGHLLGHHGHGFPTSSQLQYPSWTFSSSSSGGGGVRFYGGLSSVARPIDGSPMPGLWRVPPAAIHHRWSHFTGQAPPPSFASFRREQEWKATTTASVARGLYDDESKDGVSLDLHL